MIKRLCDKCGCEVRYHNMDYCKPTSFQVSLRIGGTTVTKDYCRNCLCDLLPGIVKRNEDDKLMRPSEAQRTIAERFEELICEIMAKELDARME